MALLDWQYSLGGVTFGTGTVYKVENITGLGLGPKRSRIYEIPGGDGVEFGREYRNGKLITFEGSIALPQDPAGAFTAALTLEGAWDGIGAGTGRVQPRTTRELRLKFPGQLERVILGRSNRFDYDIAKAKFGHILWQATFEAATR